MRRRAAVVGMAAYATSFVVVGACTAITSLDDLKTSSIPDGGSNADSAIVQSDGQVSDINPSTPEEDGDIIPIADATSADSEVTDASVTPPSFTSDGATLPGPPPAICSIGNQTDAEAQSLTFANNTPGSVEIWWVNQQCQEVHYYGIASNDDRSQNTFVTHVWRARSSSTHAVVREVGPRPNADPTTVTIP